MNNSKTNFIRDFFIKKPSQKIIKSDFNQNKVYLISFFLGLISSVLLTFHLKFLFILIIWISFYFYFLGNNIGKLRNKDMKEEIKKEIALNRIVDSFIIIGFYLAYPQFGIMYLFYLSGIIINFYNSQNRYLIFPSKFENFIVFTLMILFSDFIFFILGIYNLLIYYKGFNSLHKRFFKDK